uniref:GAF domain-containing protein n=1 Tax=Uncultured bacterium HF130_AEPn_1 TaxID=663362 RepID=D0E8J6_UNCHF|nr:GAF domain-containing protein [uncultured bacterium HF130_AEPn_1]
MNKESVYLEVEGQALSVLASEKDPIVIMSTLSCLLKNAFPHFYWVGFYRNIDGKNLKIGPYQGTLGCIDIAFGKGVCGASAQEGKTMVVPDVHEFPGHIACDPKSLSEIVVPWFKKDGELLAVLDIDSTELGSFDLLDAEYLERMLAKLSDLL